MFAASAKGAAELLPGSVEDSKMCREPPLASADSPGKVLIKEAF